MVFLNPVQMVLLQEDWVGGILHCSGSGLLGVGAGIRICEGPMGGGDVVESFIYVGLYPSGSKVPYPLNQS